MQNRYLFRGKKETGEWRIGNLIEFCENDEIVYYISVNDTSSGIFRVYVDLATIGQEAVGPTAHTTRQSTNTLRAPYILS